MSPRTGASYREGFETFDRIFGGYRDESAYRSSNISHSPYPYSSTTSAYAVPAVNYEERPVPIVPEAASSSRYDYIPVKREKTVPVVRQVKVPATVDKIVPTTEKKLVPVTKLVEEPAFDIVKEHYTDYEERPATRMKEVWVKQMVPETYMEKVAVEKVRDVKVPTTRTAEVTVMEEVEVPGTTVIKAPGFRVDEVIEHEVVEVEGRQRIEYVPRVVEEWIEESDAPLHSKAHHVVERKIGQVTYSAEDERLAKIPIDAGVDDASVVRRTAGGFVDGSHPISVTRGTIGASYGCGATLGISVKETVLGLMVKGVQAGSPFDQAGIRLGDIIYTVNDVEVHARHEWDRAVAGKGSINCVVWSKATGRSSRVIYL